MTTREDEIKALKAKHDDERSKKPGEGQVWPTPSQVELDLARMGHSVTSKAPHALPPVDTVLVEMPREMADDLQRQLEEQEAAEQKAREAAEQKSMEPAAQTDRGYVTRDADRRRRRSQQHAPAEPGLVVDSDEFPKPTVTAEETQA